MINYEGDARIYIGRNGVGTQIGIGVQPYDRDGEPTVRLVPINGKGNPANACLEVPRAKIGELIEALQNAKSHHASAVR